MSRRTTRVRTEYRAAAVLATALALGVSCADHAVGPQHLVPGSLTSREQCMDGGWRAFGFANQGQCVRFVETGKGRRTIVEEFGAESYAPNRTGQVRTHTVGDFTFTYEVIDGLAIFEGDIVLGSTGEVAQWGNAVNVETTGEDEPGIAASNLVYAEVCWVFIVKLTCKEHRWPGGVVPYEIRLDTWAAEFRSVMADTILTAIGHWEDRTGLVFVPRTGESDYVVFRDGDGCSSKLGRQGGSQNIRLAVQCGYGTAVHEIGHAIGMGHEHSRDDRDGFVQILWDNIESGRRHNFEQSSKTFDSGSYDYISIMHYPSNAFGIRDQFNPETGRFDSRRITVQPAAGAPDIGQRFGLSSGDVRAAYVMYGTPPALAIVQPSPGTVFSYRHNIRFEAEASDWSGLAPEVAWFLDGQVLARGRIANASLPLPPGMQQVTHTITAQAVDLVGRATQRTIDLVVRNLPPSAAIQSPTPASQIFAGVPFTLRAMVNDPDGGPVTCRWTSSLATDPFPVTGCDVPVTFPSGGSRTLTLTAMDERDLSATASVDVTVHGEAPAIVVTIASPADGLLIGPGQQLLLDASATGGEPPYDVVWRVNWPFDPATGAEGPNTAHVADIPTLFWRPEDTIPESDIICSNIFLKLVAEFTDATGATGSQFITLWFVHIC